MRFSAYSDRGLKVTTDISEKKKAFRTIAEKNAVLENIVSVMLKNENFLLVGHDNPDEDCLASLVSLSLVLKKFGKKPCIYIQSQIPDQLLYMTNICSYNVIPVFNSSNLPEQKPDVICIMDTPKPSMISVTREIRNYFDDAILIEIDHHLYSDAQYCGNPDYRYVDTASSTCELLAFICCKLNKRKKLLEEYNIEEFFTRNLALTLLTGMIGDTNFGLTLKTNRERFFYTLFTTYFAEILKKAYRKNSGNYSNITDIFTTIQQFSPEEKKVYQNLLEFTHFSKQTGFIFLTKKQSETFFGKYDPEIFVKVIKSVTDFLAERSGKVGATAYYDPCNENRKIQYRLRAARGCTDVDFRKILSEFKITDGGGHPGAVGFRLKAEKYTEPEIKEFNQKLIKELNEI